MPEPAPAEMFQPRPVSLQPRHHPALRPRPGRGLPGQPAVFSSPQADPHSSLCQDEEGELPGGAPDLLPLRPQQALPGAERDEVRGQARPASVLQDS